MPELGRGVGLLSEVRKSVVKDCELSSWQGREKGWAESGDQLPGAINCSVSAHSFHL
jgi:hypothetical protein